MGWVFQVRKWTLSLLSLHLFLRIGKKLVLISSKMDFWSVRDFLLNDLADLQLVHGGVVALDNFAERGHLFNLQPLRDQRGQLFN